MIELLVVIAIIAILASMLLPSLVAARDMAKRASCQGNFKQIGICSIGYQDDSSGWIPYGTAGAPHYWRCLIAQYADVKIGSVSDYWNPRLGKSIFRCPSWIDKPTCESQPFFQGGSAWNNLYLGYSDYCAPVRASALKKPSQTIMSSDGTDWTTTSGGNWDYVRLLGPYNDSLFEAPNHAVGNRHSGGVNVLWTDNHVSWASQNSLMRGENGLLDYYYRVDK